MFKNIPKHIFKIAQSSAPLPDDFVQTQSGIYMPASNLRTTSALNWNPPPRPEPPPEQPYEVNMMEALVGWKAWDYGDSLLVTQSDVKWPNDAPLVAFCNGGRDHAHESPSENCTCGIYAADDECGTSGYTDDDCVLGLVYGWGRYIRYNAGWRAQFAYPKCFYLRRGQANLIEWLRLYHVPIYIEQPQLIYNPEEDGYEYRREEADGDC